MGLISHIRRREAMKFTFFGNIFWENLWELLLFLQVLMKKKGKDDTILNIRNVTYCIIFFLFQGKRVLTSKCQFV